MEIRLAVESQASLTGPQPERRQARYAAAGRITRFEQHFHGRGREREAMPTIND